MCEIMSKQVEHPLDKYCFSSYVPLSQSIVDVLHNFSQ